jgi:hypothetical protein
MPWTRHTLSSLRARLQERVETVPFWTPEEARLALTEGLAFWNLLTGTWKARVTLDAAPASDPLLVLPTSLVFGARVAYQGQPLAPGSLAGLFRGRPTWWTETTASGGDVPTRPLLWAPVSLQLLAVWPAPAAFVASAFTVDGVAATPQLLVDASAVDLEDGVLDVLLGYALHALTFKEGWARFVGTVGHLKAFLALAGEQNTQLTQSAAYRQYMGLDRRRDLVPTRGGMERLTATVAQAGAAE